MEVLSHGTVIRSDLPARLDALPWSRWHWRIVIALGVSWMLDGLEVTLVGSLGAVLQRSDTLGLSATEIGLAGSGYIAGAVLGALYFGRLADRLGRKRIFLVTMAVYLVGTTLSALSVDFWTFAAFRFLTGFGIGGEYGAINSAIDELIPARVRGRVDLAINGSFWLGAALGAGLSLALLDPRVLGPQLGWRVAFALGAAIGVAIVLVRRHVPESPRWLLTHGQADARRGRGRRDRGGGLGAPGARIGAPPAAAHRRLALRIQPLPSGRRSRACSSAASRRRAVLGLSLMVSQAFFYNAIFFTYALVLTRFYGVADARVGLYILPFALGNFLGPLVLGPLFDTVGRRALITATYALSAAGLAVTGYAFTQGWLDAATQTACLVGYLLLRVGGGELRVSHRERSVPAGDARGRGIALLRHRHRRGRVRRAGAVRRADRQRQPRGGFCGLSGGCGADGGRGRRRGAVRSPRRAQAARSRGAAAERSGRMSSNRRSRGRVSGE